MQRALSSWTHHVEEIHYNTSPYSHLYHLFAHSSPIKKLVLFGILQFNNMLINASQKLLQLAQKGVFWSTQDLYSHVLAAGSPRTKQTTQARECLKPHKSCLALSLFPLFFHIQAQAAPQITWVTKLPVGHLSFQLYQISVHLLNRPKAAFLPGPQLRACWSKWCNENWMPVVFQSWRPGVWIFT